jgi:hypothetical protein
MRKGGRRFPTRPRRLVPLARSPLAFVLWTPVGRLPSMFAGPITDLPRGLPPACGATADQVAPGGLLPGPGPGRSPRHPAGLIVAAAEVFAQRSREHVPTAAHRAPACRLSPQKAHLP